MAKYAAITGKYIYVTVEGIEYRVYFEEAGEGNPIFCQPTAGAGGRQRRDLFGDPEFTKKIRFKNMR